LSIIGKTKEIAKFDEILTCSPSKLESKINTVVDDCPFGWQNKSSKYQ